MNSLYIHGVNVCFIDGLNSTLNPPPLPRPNCELPKEGRGHMNYIFFEVLNIINDQPIEAS